VWCARRTGRGASPFALLLPDVLVQHNSRLAWANDRRCQRADETQTSFAVDRSAAERIHMYDVSGVSEACQAEGVFGGRGQSCLGLRRWWRSRSPRPPIEPHPSPAAYILQPEIFDVSGRKSGGAGGEIQLTDAMIELPAEQQPFYGLEFRRPPARLRSKVRLISCQMSPMRSTGNIAPALPQRSSGL